MISTYLTRRVGHVHASAVVGPRPELYRAPLFVKRKVSDIDVARSLKDASRLPVHGTVMIEHHPYLTEVWRELIGTTERERERMLRENQIVNGSNIKVSQYLKAVISKSRNS